MKIFFIAAIQGKKDYGQNYEHILKCLKNAGHKVEADYLLKTSNEELNNLEQSDKLLDLHKTIINGIKNADIVVAEISYQRMSTGYFLSLALDYGKPTIALQKKGEKSHLLKTLELNEKLIVHEYSTIESLDKEIPLLINFASDQQDTRFNFFISPKHQNFLDWVSKTKKIPRSVFLRNLIEKEIDQNPDYRDQLSK